MLTGLSGEVRSGEWLHVWGPNGVGKSTLLRVLAGFHRPESGTVLWNDKPIHENLKTYRRTLRYIGDQPALLSELTVRDNRKLYSSLFDLRDLGYSGRIDDLPPGQRVADLSHGQKKRVQLAMLFAHEPELILLDEPMLALDRDASARLRERLEVLREDGTLIVTASPAPEDGATRLWNLGESD